jgi:hypothetical protein
MRNSANYLAFDLGQCHLNARLLIVIGRETVTTHMVVVFKK